MDTDTRIKELLEEYRHACENIPRDLPYEKYRTAQMILTQDYYDKIMEIYF